MTFSPKLPEWTFSHESDGMIPVATAEIDVVDELFFGLDY